MPAAGTPRKRRSALPAQTIVQRAKEASQGTRVGRPRSYSPELCEQAVALGLKGKHPAAIARLFGVDKATLVKWAADYPEFSNALSRAKTYSQAWWEDDVQRNRKAKHYQANPVRMILSGQFKEDYADNGSSSNSNGLDLGALVGAISQGVAAATLEAGRQKDDAATAAQDVAPTAVAFAKPRE